MPLYAGPVWRHGIATDGFLRVEGDRVLEEGEGTPAGARPSVILDGLHNYHTHVGDAFLAGRPLPRRLEDLVRPITGYKHRMLARAPRSTIVNGIRRALLAHGEAGTRSLLDFREQGVLGLRAAHAAHRALGPEAPALRLLGRPARSPPERQELESVLEAADGLGLSSWTDEGPERSQALATACHAAKKPFALHASEARREDIDAVLALRPQLLVHLCAATNRDLRRVADAGIPVALCPTSNAYFRLQPPLEALHALGIRFFFGTDNAMLGGTELTREVALARRWGRRIPDSVFLKGLTTPPEKAINRIEPIAPSRASAARIVVLPRRGRRVQWQARPLVVRR